MPTDSEVTLAALRRTVLAFRDARDWAQFHQPKDLALALAIEAAEVLELFRFKTDPEIQALVEAGDVTDLGHELADVLYWVLLLSHEAGVDLAAAMEEKLAISGHRYPVELARGRKVKYTELRPREEPAEESPAPPRVEALPVVQKPNLLVRDVRRRPLPLPRRGGDPGEGLEDAGSRPSEGP